MKRISAVCDGVPLRAALLWILVTFLLVSGGLAQSYISIRNEFYDDTRGQRTGYKTWYTEHTVMWGHWISDLITIRPELRFERAYNMPAYDLGTKKNQFTFAVDAIIRY